MLASIHTYDKAAGCDSTTFQPCSDKALSNLLTYVNAFRTVYAIDSGIANNVAVATGRYPEDSYQGGNVRQSSSVPSYILLITKNSLGTLPLSPSLSCSTTR